jgi:outer membrane protein assembly factor BamC
MRNNTVFKSVLYCATGVAVSFVSGCGTLFGDDGYFRDRGDDYLKAQSVDLIKLPADSQGDRIGQLFVIPNISDPDAHLPKTFEVPQPSSAERAVDPVKQVKIQTLGERRWIDINNPPGEVWPGVRAFLSSNNMAVAEQDPTAGTLETAWLSPNKERYRIQLTSGLRPNSTEIHVVQTTAAASANVWPEQSIDKEREAQIVKDLANYLAANTSSQASMMAQSIGNHERRVVFVQSPEPALSMRVDYARAWASVSGALGSDGFQVVSADRAQGQWQVTFTVQASEKKDAESSSKRGMFASLGNALGLGDDGQSTGLSGNYRVLLQKQSDENSLVLIRNSNGEILPAADADALLRRIRDNLL